MRNNVFAKYKYVYEVYKEKSFTKAAKKLFISQPSLSAAIRNIEREMGVPLFDRGTAEIIPTEAGKAYIYSCEKILNIESELENRINDIYKLQIGSLAVGGTNYLSSYVLPEIVSRFTALFPKIEVSLTEANSGALLEMLDREDIDILIDSFDESVCEYESFPLLRERIFLCVPAEWKINERLKENQIHPQDVCNNKVDIDSVPSIPISEFKDEKFILLKSGNDMFNRANDMFMKENVVPKVLFSVDQLNISYLLVESGMGACFVTDTLIRYGNFHKKVILYNVEKGCSNRTLSVAYKKNRYCTTAMQEFIKIAKDCVRLDGN